MVMDVTHRLAALEHPTRRALYDLIAESTEPMGREAAAGALGLSRSTAAFHLDALATAGLLAVEFRRPGGRRGPGAGRPTKLYTPAAEEISVSVPPRRYELAADLFAGAIAESARTGAGVRDVLRERAAADGRARGERAGTFEAALASVGFTPREEPAGDLVMGNCPFHQLAQAHTELVCELNYSLVRGMAEGAACGRRVVADPGAGRCCVRAEASPERGAGPP
ncbi:metalloregulator ArsR/SmtB family transcription factor [Occultella aeris]|uniref:Helix-turn-helix domain protein n=2 Tax=Occultella aeris TaxID=2761496 RepID=A0A7M4DI36_9MICO|nr:helix-turn-helix domain-containing protein [Occultella aeris]VZO36600.1 Helix-turn-helix domain protein [Occultella aeris]